jgi:hypothetical protein
MKKVKLSDKLDSILEKIKKFDGTSKGDISCLILWKEFGRYYLGVGFDMDKCDFWTSGYNTLFEATKDLNECIDENLKDIERELDIDLDVSLAPDDIVVDDQGRRFKVVPID